MFFVRPPRKGRAFCSKPSILFDETLVDLGRAAGMFAKERHPKRI